MPGAALMQTRIRNLGKEHFTGSTELGRQHDENSPVLAKHDARAVRTKKARDVQDRLEREGWVWLSRRGAGSHRYFVHASRRGVVSLPWHRNGQQPISPGVYAAIKKTAG